MERQQHACQHCGHAGNDVHLWPVRIGGRGLVGVEQCDDVAACWQRWERQQKTVMPPGSSPTAPERGH